jgi:hypothetical protein
VEPKQNQPKKLLQQVNSTTIYKKPQKIQKEKPKRKLKNQVWIFFFLLLVTKKRKETLEEPNNEDDGEFNRDNFSSSQVASTFKEYLKTVKFSSFLEIENPIQLKLYLVLKKFKFKIQGKSPPSKITRSPRVCFWI